MWSLSIINITKAYQLLSLTIPNLCRKYAGPALDLDNFEVHQKIPLTAYGRPGLIAVIYQLVW